MQRDGLFINTWMLEENVMVIPFQISTKLFHWEAKFKESWLSDSDVTLPPPFVKQF